MSLSNTNTAILFYAIFACYFILLVAYLYKRLVVDARHVLNVADDYNNGPEKKLGIKSLSIEDWVSLYSKIFDSSGNQLVLTSEHIVNKENKTNENLSDTEETASTSNDEDSFVDIEAGQENNLSLGLSKSVGGSCAICSNKFEKGDEIVWSSSSPSTIVAGGGKKSEAGGCCQHIYHKDCMARHLASISHQQCQGYNERAVPTKIECPCPICGQRFCTVSEKDIAEAIASRYIQNKIDDATASETETTGSS